LAARVHADAAAVGTDPSEHVTAGEKPAVGSELYDPSGSYYYIRQKLQVLACRKVRTAPRSILVKIPEIEALLWVGSCYGVSHRGNGKNIYHHILFGQVTARDGIQNIPSIRIRISAPTWFVGVPAGPAAVHVKLLLNADNLPTIYYS
jgi:hypothetical protein